MSRNLALVVCGAPLAHRAADLAGALIGDGWTTTVIATQSGREWLDLGRIERVTGSPAVSDYRQLDEPRRGAGLDQVVICPLTMNTGSKLALGIMDSYVLGVLCEALADGVPIAAVTTVNNRLWRHPRWASNVRFLLDAGVSFIDARTGHLGEPRPVQSGTGGEVVASFDPGWVVTALRGQATPTS